MSDTSLSVLNIIDSAGLNDTANCMVSTDTIDAAYQLSLLTYQNIAKISDLFLITRTHKDACKTLREIKQRFPYIAEDAEKTGKSSFDTDSNENGGGNHKELVGLRDTQDCAKKTTAILVTAWQRTFTEIFNSSNVTAQTEQLTLIFLPLFLWLNNKEARGMQRERFLDRVLRFFISSEIPGLINIDIDTLVEGFTQAVEQLPCNTPLDKIEGSIRSIMDTLHLLRTIPSLDYQSHFIYTKSAQTLYDGMLLALLWHGQKCRNKTLLEWITQGMYERTNLEYVDEAKKIDISQYPNISLLVSLLATNGGVIKHDDFEQTNGWIEQFLPNYATRNLLDFSELSAFVSHESSLSLLNQNGVLISPLESRFMRTRKRNAYRYLSMSQPLPHTEQDEEHSEIQATKIRMLLADYYADIFETSYDIGELINVARSVTQVQSYVRQAFERELIAESEDSDIEQVQSLLQRFILQAVFPQAVLSVFLPDARLPSKRKTDILNMLYAAVHTPGNDLSGIVDENSAFLPSYVVTHLMDVIDKGGDKSSTSREDVNKTLRELLQCLSDNAAIFNTQQDVIFYKQEPFSVALETDDVKIQSIGDKENYHPGMGLCNNNSEECRKCNKHFWAFMWSALTVDGIDFSRISHVINRIDTQGLAELLSHDIIWRRFYPIADLLGEFIEALPGDERYIQAIKAKRREFQYKWAYHSNQIRSYQRFVNNSPVKGYREEREIEHETSEHPDYVTADLLESLYGDDDLDATQNNSKYNVAIAKAALELVRITSMDNTDKNTLLGTLHRVVLLYDMPMKSIMREVNSNSADVLRNYASFLDVFRNLKRMVYRHGLNFGCLWETPDDSFGCAPDKYKKYVKTVLADLVKRVIAITPDGSIDTFRFWAIFAYLRAFTPPGDKDFERELIINFMEQIRESDAIDTSLDTPISNAYNAYNVFYHLSHIYTNPTTLKEKIREAEAGAHVVFDENDMVSLNSLIDSMRGATWDLISLADAELNHTFSSFNKQYLTTFAHTFSELHVDDILPIGLTDDVIKDFISFLIVTQILTGTQQPEQGISSIFSGKMAWVSDVATAFRGWKISNQDVRDAVMGGFNIARLYKSTERN